MTPSRKDRVSLPSDSEVNNVRPDLDKRTPAEVAKAEKTTRGHVKRNARDEGEKKSFLGQLFGGSK